MSSQDKSSTGKTELTIHDVAKAAGVSITTVSRVLNDREDVSDATRKRVQEVIKELEYVPYTQALRQTSSKTNAIALLYPLQDRLHSGFTQLELDFMLGAATAVGERRYSLNLITGDPNRTDLLALYEDDQVDGVILMDIRLDDWRVDLLREHDLPFVMIGQHADNTGLSFIALDLENAVIMAFDHLVALGHREIGFLTYPQDMFDENLGYAIRSMAGYERAIQKHNLNSHFSPVQFSSQHTYEAAQNLLDDVPQLTAFVTIYGATASGIIRAVQDRGLRIPAEVSLVGQATEAIAETLIPALTAIDFPAYQMGYQAVNMLLTRLNNGPGLTQILIPPTLTARESTGPVQSRD